MLINLPNDKQDATLINNSGIQFLDFGLSFTDDSANSGHFVRQSTNGPLLRLDYDIIPGKFTLPDELGGQPEIVRPESTFTLSHSLDVLNNTWLPLPFLRLNTSTRYGAGPDNWVRFHIHRLDTPDRANNTLRISLAFDTQIHESDSTMAKLMPTHDDVRNATSFGLAWRNEELIDFLDQTWVDGWLRETFTHYATEQEARSEKEINNALKTFEYQAHYLNVLELLGTQLTIPTITLSGENIQSPAIPVDLILDVGSTHTCGILIEDHGPDNRGLDQCMELQIRSLSEPCYVNNPLFSSRVEFNEASFGNPTFSTESGRERAFVWPSMVRIGEEAHKMALLRTGSEGASGLSSPRRYLWDNAPTNQEWRFSQHTQNNSDEPPAISLPLMSLLNDNGEPLYPLPLHERLPVFTPYYSPGSLMTMMLSELLAQALMQINSVASRQAMGRSNAPRQLRQLILTLPSAMPAPERERFHQRMQEAIALVWKVLGWHPRDDDFTTEADTAKCVIPAPTIAMDWDEASCGQLVWLYHEIHTKYAGEAALFFRSLRRPERVVADSPQPKESLRVALIDIGGGTMDLAITQYTLDEGIGSNVKISPQLLFLEGFKSAGDDILLDIIQQYVLPALQAYMKHCGVDDADGVMRQLFGQARGSNDRNTQRQQATLQLFIPLGLAIMKRWEKQEPYDHYHVLVTRFGELLSEIPAANTLDYITRAVRANAGGVRNFNILDTPITIDFSALNSAMLTEQFSVSAPLMALCEAVEHYCCDVLLVSGRPGSLPGVQMLIRRHQPVPVSRMVWMHRYAIEANFPHNQHGNTSNMKSTASTGAMIFHLASGLRLPGFNFKSADIQVRSTLRYLGAMDANNRLPDENVWYHHSLTPSGNGDRSVTPHFPLRGDIRLGFRQLANPRWPATPLYTLRITSPELMKEIAGDGVVYVQLKQNRNNIGFSISGARMQSGKKIPTEWLSLTLTTATHSQYWIDTGSIFSK